MKKRFILAMATAGLLFATNLSAKSLKCDSVYFSYKNSFNVANHLSIAGVLAATITDKCGIPVIYKDKTALDVLTKTKAPYLNIKNYTLKDMLDTLVGGLGFFYQITDKGIYIQSTKIKIFKINFISSARKGSSNLSTTDSKISNNYTFEFWSKLKERITEILKSSNLIM